MNRDSLSPDWLISSGVYCTCPYMYVSLYNYHLNEAPPIMSHLRLQIAVIIRLKCTKRVNETGIKWNANG